jgi:5-methyltetrahydrofolate--homocysteine methyltransferase
MSERLVQLVADMEEEQALVLVRQLLEGGVDPVAILDDGRAAMAVVGRRFEAGEYFIPELILAGEILASLSAEVKPHLVQNADATQGARVLLGTVKGDIHDIGKDIVRFMLDVSGCQGVGLGVDVPAETFVEKIREVRPPVVALSGLLTLAYASMKQTIEAIRAAGLRDQVKIMVGGGTLDQRVCDDVKADAFGKDAMAAVTLARQWTGGN